jgi:hypothetical protein
MFVLKSYAFVAIGKLFKEKKRDSTFKWHIHAWKQHQQWKKTTTVTAVKHQQKISTLMNQNKKNKKIKLKTFLQNFSIKKNFYFCSSNSKCLVNFSKWIVTTVAFIHFYSLLS